jgi:hypothetical protein
VNERKVNTQGGRQFDSAQLHYFKKTECPASLKKRLGILLIGDMVTAIG